MDEIEKGFGSKRKGYNLNIFKAHIVGNFCANRKTDLFWFFDLQYILCLLQAAFSEL